MNWEDWVLRGAAFVGAVVALATALMRYIVRPAYDLTVGDKLDSLHDRLAGKLDKVADGFAEQLASHISESDRRFDAIHADMTRLAGEVRAANARIDGMLMTMSGHPGPGRRATDAGVLQLLQRHSAPTTDDDEGEEG